MKRAPLFVLGSALLLAGAVTAVVACDKATADKPKPADSTATTAAPTPTERAPAAAAAHVEDATYVLDFVPPTDCKAGAECTATLRLQAQDPFHINDEGYPYRFVAAEGGPASVTFLGKEQDGRQFSRAAGDFKIDDPKRATLTVRFKAGAPGKVKLAGTYYMAVCTKENCKPIKSAVAVDVPVT